MCVKAYALAYALCRQKHYKNHGHEYRVIKNGHALISVDKVLCVFGWVSNYVLDRLAKVHWWFCDGRFAPFEVYAGW
jgi:hypothetical protein